MRSVPILLAGALFAAGLCAQQTRVYLAPDDHTDLWWTADEATYQQAFLATIDYYLGEMDATAGAPSDFQARWNCDGSLWMWTYEHNRTAADFQRFLSRVADGHMSVPLNPLCVCLGGAPAEAVLRSMYYPGRVGRRSGLAFPLAYTMENSTQPLGLWSLFAGSGARWSWKGICGCNGFNPNAWDRDHEIYWGTGLDGQQILVKWHSMPGTNTAIGGYAEARDPFTIVDYVTNDAGFQARYPFPVIGCFGKGWDDLQTMTGEFPIVAQQQTNANRRVRVSNEQDFFTDFELNHGAQLPSESRTYGNEWDLHCAALAEVSAHIRRAVEKLRSAEAMAVVAGRQRATLLDGRDAARDLAFLDLGLYFEHNFGMDGISLQSPLIAGRIAWQRRLAGEVDAYVDSLHADTAQAIGDLIPTGAVQRCFVFNPLGLLRTDVADLAWGSTAAVHVVDLATGNEAPSQLVTRNGNGYLRFLARDLPPVGYRVYELRPGAGAQFPPAATVSGVTDITLDAIHWAVTVTPRGAITSLIDHTQADREYVRVVGGRAMNDLGAGAGTLAVENVGPVSVSVRAVATGPLPHTSVITIYRDVDRIDVDDSIDAGFQATTTWAFGVNSDAPDVHHEEVGAILHADIAPQGHYSPRVARYDWMTLNHFADLSDQAGFGLTLSNRDCYFFKLGNSNQTTLDTATPQLSVLAGGTGLGSPYGLQQQGGDSSFIQRFALQTHGAYDPAAAMRIALQHQNPVVTGLVTGAFPGLPAAPYGLITVGDPNVLLWAFKPHDDGLGSGIVARAWNLSNQPLTCSLGLTQDTLRAAFACTHLENDVIALPVAGNAVTLPFQPQQLRTVRLVHTTAATVRTFGSGCASPAGTPLLQPENGSVPIIGQPVHLQLSGYPSGSLLFALGGFSSVQWGPNPLPMALQPFGFPAGCLLLVSPDATVVVPDQAGVAHWSLPIPSNYQLMGLSLFTQGAALTFGPTFGSVSNGCELVVGYR